MLIEANTTDEILNIIGDNDNRCVESNGKIAEPQIAGDRHVFGLMADGCKLINGFHWYDETRGWPSNPDAKRKKYLTLAELLAIKENLIAAMDSEMSQVVQNQIEQAKRIVLDALGEI